MPTCPDMNTTKSSKTYGHFYAHVHSKAHSPRSREVYLRWVERLGEYYQPDGPGLRRLSEALLLKPPDIDSGRGVVRVRHGKGDKAREVPICPEMITRLQIRAKSCPPSLLHGTDVCFCRSAKNKHAFRSLVAESHQHLSRRKPRQHCDKSFSHRR